MTLDLGLLSGDLEPGSWQFEAACAGSDDRLFFPSRGSSTKVARAICWGDGEDKLECPVRMDCLDHAITNKENAGIWGGMSVRERRIEAQKRGKNFPQREIQDEALEDLIADDLRLAEELLQAQG